MLASPKYVGADEAVLMASMTGKFTFGSGDTRATPEFNLFFDQQASYPFYSDGIWFLTQMRRWGQIAADKPDAWYLDTVKSVYRPDLYDAAAQSLVADGKASAQHAPRLLGRQAPAQHISSPRLKCLKITNSSGYKARPWWCTRRLASSA